MILQLEIFLTQLYFFPVVHAYRKLTHTHLSHSSITPLTLSADAYIRSEARIETHYITSTHLQKANIPESNMVKIATLIATGLLLAILVGMAQGSMIYALSTSQYMIGRYYFSV